MAEHVVLVAFGVEADTMEEAQEHLMQFLIPTLASNNPNSNVEEWWIAEDERYDRSDNEAAVFIPLGITQLRAREILVAHRMKEIR